MDVDLLLKKYGVKFEDLNAVERETFNNMLSSVQKGQLTMEKWKDYLIHMRDSLILEISSYDTASKQDLFIKARIRNYTLQIAFLDGPEKAKKALEMALSGLK